MALATVFELYKQSLKDLWTIVVEDFSLHLLEK